MAILEGSGLTKFFGGIQALDNVSFAIDQGTIVGLIGPNGAGKTTLFNAIAGAIRPSSGQVIFEGKTITGMPANKICRSGIARTFQVTRPFADMTCLENVGVGIVNHHKHCDESRWRQMALDRLRYLDLADAADTPAGKLNVIQKKRLEIARALATGPRLIMLDEVLGGLNTQEIQEAIGFIQKLRDDLGLTVFWIEHVMGAVMRAAQKIIVLDQGRILMEGTPETVVNDPRVIQAYLGE